MCVELVFVVIGMGLLNGCGSTKTTHLYAFRGVARVTVTKRTPEAITEEGRLSGTLDANLILHINLGTGHMTYTISNPKGKFEGAAEVLQYQLSGPVRHFEEKGPVIEGTGEFAHVRSNNLTFKTVDNEVLRVITVAVTGILSY